MKICFNNDLFLMVNSPKDPNVGFIFNKKNGEIFQVEDVTKDMVFDLISSPKDESKFIKDYIKKYNLGGEDVKKIKFFIEEIKYQKIIKNFKK